MAHRCEVCESFRPGSDLGPARELVEVLFRDPGDPRDSRERRVLLCRGHAAIARNSEVSSFDELRALYAESEGMRSYISRRARGIVASESSPRSAGRRAGDLAR